MMTMIWVCSDDCFNNLAQNVSTQAQPPILPKVIPLSRNFNYVGKNAKGLVQISKVPVYASLQRGQYQLKCIKLNKYQPVKLFQLLDPATGLRANRSAAGKKKEDARDLIRNPIKNAEVSHLITSLH